MFYPFFVWFGIIFSLMILNQIEHINEWRDSESRLTGWAISHSKKWSKTSKKKLLEQWLREQPTFNLLILAALESDQTENCQMYHCAQKGLPARQKVARQMAKIRRSSLSMAKSHRSYLIKLFATCFSYWLVLHV